MSRAAEEKAKRAQAALEAERARTERMYLFEHKYAGSGLICGVDEVGRGPLAGPVCAGAVILPSDHPVLYLNDSKKLSEKKREKMYDVIRAEAVAYATAFVEPGRIDEINILQATYEAMAEAVAKLSAEPSVLLVDAVHIPQLEGMKQVSIIKGDAQSASIAAASILAKVERDRLMREYDRQYPAYGFASNKGYGTAAHIEALKRAGPCPLHRHTFIAGILGKS